MWKSFSEPFLRLYFHAQREQSVGFRVWGSGCEGRREFGVYRLGGVREENSDVRDKRVKTEGVSPLITMSKTNRDNPNSLSIAYRAYDFTSEKICFDRRTVKLRDGGTNSCAEGTCIPNPEL